MKFTVEKHKNMLANMEYYLEQQRNTMERSVEAYNECLSRFTFYQQQIDEAERRGKESFDSGRFMHPRKEKD